MAKQLNLLSTGQVIATALHTEMQRSYLEYAMSVIVGRGAARCAGWIKARASADIVRYARTGINPRFALIVSARA